MLLKMLVLILSVSALPVFAQGSENPCLLPGDVYTPFSLTPIKELPDMTAVLEDIGAGIINKPPRTPLDAPPELRLDLCANYDQDGQPTVTLRRLNYAYTEAGFSRRRVIVAMDFTQKEGEDVVRGVTDAAFGDASRLLINYEPTESDGFLVQGFTVGDQVIVMAGKSMISRVDGKRVSTNGQWLAGTLEMGDRISQSCSDGRSPQNFQYTIGPTMGLRMKACTSRAGVSSIAYYPVSVTWTNPDPSLPPADQGPKTVTGESLKEVFNYKYSHHNCEDSLNLKLGYGSFSIKWNSFEKKKTSIITDKDGAVIFESSEVWESPNPC